MRAAGGDDEFLEVRMTIDAFEPVRAFTLVLEAEGDVIQAPFLFHEGICADTRDYWNMEPLAAAGWSQGPWVRARW
jgi:hypothetical protein